MGMRETTWKIQDLSKIDAAVWHHWRRNCNKRIVATNGCFDLIHVGHIKLLEHARMRGDVLVVGLNSDSSVRQLKGEGRPINTEMDRATVLAAIQAVDTVVIFNFLTATGFLELVRPHVWVKGGDYTLETLDQREVEAVRSCGGQVELFPTVPGYSTTKITAVLSGPTSPSIEGVCAVDRTV
jgi:rfaE bifunctional protein nucleotidyltransferase chain/domain